MVSISVLKKEHEIIKRELKEFEVIMEEEELNVPNLIHVFRKLHDLWNSHEQREDEFFSKIDGTQFDGEIEKMLFEHRSLNGHKIVIDQAVKSGSDIEIKTALDTDGRMLVDKISKHIEKENKLFNKIAFSAG